MDDSRSNRLTVFIAMVISASLLAAGCAGVPKREITRTEFLGHIRVLASDEMRGRGNGTPELGRAARYIMREFRRAGLQPAEEFNYLQYFSIRTGSRLSGENALTLRIGEHELDLDVGSDYVPISFGGEQRLSAPLVFAGYGITAPEIGYDDYAGIDAAGKAVLVLALEPQRDRVESPFEGTLDTTYAQNQHKILNARGHGAAAVILVRGPLHRRPQDSELPSMGVGFVVEEMGLPAVAALASPIEELLASAGFDLLALQRQIDDDLQPRSDEIDGAQVSLCVNVRSVRRRVANVVGVLPGSDPELRHEVIVVGAHYDHIGLGYRGSMDPSGAGEVHNGADDNASGTSGLIEIAERFGLDLARPRRTIVFVAFAGEELGLLGSTHFAANPPVPAEGIVAMVNMDMIGRPSSDRLIVGGVGTAAEFRPLLEAANRRFRFDLILHDSGLSASDHTAFVARSIPALFFFSGVHTDYHRPSDDWERIDAAGGTAIARFVAEVVSRIDHLDERPRFVEVAGQQHPPAGRGGGEGTWFGSVPDFSYQGEGYRFQAIIPGSPAERAGLRAQDILIEFAGRGIGNIYDFTAALRAHGPGDAVEVVVIRDGERLRVSVTLARRQ